MLRTDLVTFADHLYGAYLNVAAETDPARREAQSVLLLAATHMMVEEAGPKGEAIMVARFRALSQQTGETAVSGVEVNG